MTFEDYLISKKIDGRAFQAAEPELYKTWDQEFSHMHPNSFTAQKLYLINPIRLKYHLPQQIANVKAVDKNNSNETGSKRTFETSSQTQLATPSAVELPEVADTKPTQPVKSARPVFKPKPKTN